MRKNSLGSLPYHPPALPLVNVKKKNWEGDFSTPPNTVSNEDIIRHNSKLKKARPNRRETFTLLPIPWSFLFSFFIMPDPP